MTTKNAAAVNGPFFAPFREHLAIFDEFGILGLAGNCSFCRAFHDFLFSARFSVFFPCLFHQHTAPTSLWQWRPKIICTYRRRKLLWRNEVFGRVPWRSSKLHNEQTTLEETPNGDTNLRRLGLDALLVICSAKASTDATVIIAGFADDVAAPERIFNTVHGHQILRNFDFCLSPCSDRGAR